MPEAVKIHVKGVVQGVGFRPFVYRLAKHYLIVGWVLNAKDGVFIHAEGDANNVAEFVNELHTNPPAAAQVKELELEYVPLEGFTSFEIRKSSEGEAKQHTLVSADLATCDACASELFDPNCRRFRYPFINCTNCGPRFTIIDKLPYDRPSTSMKSFHMCKACETEYNTPDDRRFHAQPNACFECGPNLSLYVSAEGGWHKAHAASREESDKFFKVCARMLVAGGIVAVKGLGGFHLVCDASNPKAIEKLRARKHRPDKPFAVMVANAQAAAAVCNVSEAEKQQLEAPARPIVLLQKRRDINFAAGLADKLPELGVMLPTTPVQHLLLHDFEQELQEGTFVQDTSDNANDGSNKTTECNSMPAMLVMTSGNLHNQPIVINDSDALDKFEGVADAVLGNNRVILTRFDDSVLRAISAGEGACAVQFMRRARGFAPLPIPFAITDNDSSGENATQSPDARKNTKGNSDIIFATGPQQKATSALCSPNANEQGAYSAFVSQHIGNVENAEVFDAWLEAKARFEQLFSLKPTKIVCDSHPEYTTTKWAQEQQHAGTSIKQVQHHHAHIASVLGENNLNGAVCGIAFDGTGFGADGKIWGGEVLIANQQAFERFANFTYVPMPGGAACIKNPLRMAYGVLYAFDLLEHPAAAAVIQGLGSAANVCEQMIDAGINTPYTSSVGRLFDAASAMLGVCTNPTYEGQPAIELEALLWAGANDAGMNAQDAYAIDIIKNSATKNSTAQDTSVVLFDASAIFRQLLDDVQANVPAKAIALKFHNAFVNACVSAAMLVQSVYGIKTVALSGGVFANRYIIQQTIARLQSAGFSVAINKNLPPNDGCISFGQAVVAANLIG